MRRQVGRPPRQPRRRQRRIEAVAHAQPLVPKVKCWAGYEHQTGASAELRRVRTRRRTAERASLPAAGTSAGVKRPRVAPGAAHNGTQEAYLRNARNIAAVANKFKGYSSLERQTCYVQWA